MLACKEGDSNLTVVRHAAPAPSFCTQSHACACTPSRTPNSTHIRMKHSTSLCAPMHRLDPFTARLLGILRASRARRAALAASGRPEVALGIHRTDYMLDKPSQGFLQV